MISSVKNLIKITIRISVSLILIAWLLSRMDILKIVKQFIGVNWILIVILIPLLHVFIIVLRSFRLSMILKGLGFRTPLWWLSMIQLKGMFLGCIFPGSISGDLYRTYKLAKISEHGLESVSSIVVEKSFGLSAMIFTSLVALLYGFYFIRLPVFNQLAHPMFIFAGLFFTIMIVGILFVRYININSGFVKSIQGLDGYLIKGKAIIGHFIVFFSSKADFFKMIMISVLLQISIVTWYFIVSKAIGLNVWFLTLMVTVPIVEMMIMLPISISGIGLRESAFVLLLVPFGFTPEKIVSFSLLVFIVQIILRILSGVTFLLELDHKAYVTRNDGLEKKLI